MREIRSKTKAEYRVRLAVMVLMDMITVFLSYFLGLWIRFEFSIARIPRLYIGMVAKYAIIAAIVSIIIYYCLRLYHSIWRFAGIADLLRIIIAYLILAPILILITRIPSMRIPYSVLLMGYIFSGICCLGLRFGLRMLRYVSSEGKTTGKESDVERVMIVGAGQAAHEIIKDLQLGRQGEYHISTIVDDNPIKKNRYLEGIKIEGSREDIPRLAEKYQIDKIIFAIPTATAEERAAILNICEETGCHVDRKSVV